MIDLDATVLASGFGAFGETVSYAPTAGGVYPLTGVFNIENMSIAMDEGATVSTRRPLLDLRGADLAAAGIAAAQNDTVTCRGVAYRVRDVRPDGNGVVQLALNEAP